MSSKKMREARTSCGSALQHRQTLLSVFAQSSLVVHSIFSFLAPFDGVRLLSSCKDVVCLFPWRNLICGAITKGSASLSSSSSSQQQQQQQQQTDVSCKTFCSLLSQSLADCRPLCSRPRQSIWNHIHQINFLQTLGARLDAAKQPVTKTAFGADCGAFRIGLLTRLFVGLYPTVSAVCVRCKECIEPEQIGRYLILSNDRTWRGGLAQRQIATESPLVFKPIQRALGFATLDSNSYLAHVIGSTIIPCLCQECAERLAILVEASALIGFEDVLYMGDIAMCTVTDVVGSVPDAQAFAVVSLQRSRHGLRRCELAFSPTPTHESAKVVSNSVRVREQALLARSRALEDLYGVCTWIETSFFPLYIDQLLLPVWNTYIGRLNQKSILEGDVLVTLCESTRRAELMIQHFATVPRDQVASEIPKQLEIIDLVAELLSIGKGVERIAKLCTDRFVVEERHARHQRIVTEARRVLLDEAGMKRQDVDIILGNAALHFGAEDNEIVDTLKRLNAIIECIRNRGHVGVRNIDDYIMAFFRFENDQEHLELSRRTILAAINPIPVSTVCVKRNLPIPPPIRMFRDPAVHYDFEMSSSDEEEDDGGFFDDAHFNNAFEALFDHF